MWAPLSYLGLPQQSGRAPPQPSAMHAGDDLPGCDGVEGFGKLLEDESSAVTSASTANTGSQALNVAGRDPFSMDASASVPLATTDNAVDGHPSSAVSQRASTPSESPRAVSHSLAKWQIRSRDDLSDERVVGSGQFGEVFFATLRGDDGKKRSGGEST